MSGPPDPEVSDRPRRRRFNADYKRGIVRAAERCTKPGEIGILLRREGLYSSHLADWRRELFLPQSAADPVGRLARQKWGGRRNGARTLRREKGGTSALSPKKRGRKAKEADPAEKRALQLFREQSARMPVA